MSTYRVAAGHDVALVSLTVLDPQPRSTGIQVTRRSHGADGSVYDEGEYVELVWDFFEDAAAYQAMLATFNLDGDLAADVTVYVRDDQFNFVRKNGIAVRPELGRDGRWENYFLRDVTILVKHLEDAA